MENKNIKCYLPKDHPEDDKLNKQIKEAASTNNEEEICAAVGLMLLRNKTEARMEKQKQDEQTQIPIMSVVVGSTNKFTGTIQESGQHNIRPLMVNGWSQTTVEDFAYLHELENREKQFHREKKLEEDVTLLQAMLKAQTELLCEIHATSANTSALLSQQQQQSQNEQDINNSGLNNNINNSTNLTNSTTRLLGDHKLDESLEYTIIAEGRGDGQPTEFQLAEDDGPLDVTSPVDSEICRDPEENIPTTSKQNTIPSPKNINNPDCDTSIISYDPENVMVAIGPNNTRIPLKVYKNINWNSASIATRKLLMTIFDRKVLATHTMTGKPSPAFRDQNKPLKQMLDPLVIADIIFAVTGTCHVSDKEVRNAITTKCADETKMMKLQMNKRMPMREINKENLLK